MTDIKFTTYPYTPIKNIKDEQILLKILEIRLRQVIMMIKDYKHLMELRYIHMEQMFLKYVKMIYF